MSPLHVQNLDILVATSSSFSDDEIETFWKDRKSVFRLGSYLARSVEWDLHWSKKIVETMFSEEYKAEHRWPSET